MPKYRHFTIKKIQKSRERLYIYKNLAILAPIQIDTGLIRLGDKIYNPRLTKFLAIFLLSFYKNQH